MSQWYRAKEGTAYGPMSEEAIRAMLDAGEILPTDLVCQEGMPAWVSVAESGLKLTRVSTSPKPIRTLDYLAPEWKPEAQWYYQKDGIQHGPMSEQVIRSVIEAGRILPDDFVWQEGTSDWVPMAESWLNLTPVVERPEPLGPVFLRTAVRFLSSDRRSMYPGARGRVQQLPRRKRSIS